jgi:hypothetical protein
VSSNKSELYREARRCADAASKGVSPGHQRLFSGLAKFYETLAKLEPEPGVIPKSSAARFDFGEQAKKEAGGDGPTGHAS